MRIVAGRQRGRKLLVPADRRIRPTSDRAREALFDILEHRPPGVREARVLDLCAGTGALGLEAWSRGAAAVTLVDDDRDAVALIRRNLALFGDPPEVRVVKADAARLPATLRDFDLVLLDPPYRSGLAATILDRLPATLLAPDALLVLETEARDEPALPAALTVEDDRRYGATRFRFLRPAQGVEQP